MVSLSVRWRIWEEKGCGYRTTPARLKGTAVLSPRGLGRIAQTNPSSLHEQGRISTVEPGQPLRRLLFPPITVLLCLRHGNPRHERQHYTTATERNRSLFVKIRLFACLLEFHHTLKIISRILREVVNRVKSAPPKGFTR